MFQRYIYAGRDKESTRADSPEEGGLGFEVGALLEGDRPQPGEARVGGYNFEKKVEPGKKKVSPTGGGI